MNRFSFRPLLALSLLIAPFVLVACDSGGSNGNGDSGDSPPENTVQVTNDLDGDLKFEIQGTDRVNWSVDEQTGGSLVGTGGVASGSGNSFTEDIPDTDEIGGSGFDRYELTTEETKGNDVSYTLRLLNDGNEVAAVQEPGDDGNGSATIEVQAP